MQSKRPLRTLLFITALCLALPASAEIYKWKNANGETVMSDKPPPGQVKVPQRVLPAQAQPQPPQQQPSLADREMEFRKRQKEAAENAEKAAKEAAAAAKKEETCQSARRQLSALESGTRITLRDDKGERYYLEDAQRAQEIAKTRSFLETQCN